MSAEKVIRKHVAIIHAYSLMSALQRKIVNVLLYEATKKQSVVDHIPSVAVECRMPFSLLSKSINFNSNNTQYLKEAIDGLASLKIEWNLLKDRIPTDISFLNLRVLHGSPTFYQDGTFNFSFHKVMLMLTHNPPVYGTIDLDVQAQFESKYGHALYENSTRFVNLNKTKVVDLDTFKKLLGVDANKYPSMRELTRNVIQPSVEEVNDRANFTVKLSSVKAGKKIIGFELYVNARNKAAQTIGHTVTDQDAKLYQTITKTFGGISKNVLENIISHYSEEYIVEKISYVQKFAKKDGKGYYPVPYFISALRDNYKEGNEINEPPIIMPAVPGNDTQWQIKEHALKADLAHWKKVVEHLDKEKNLAVFASFQKIIENCEENLRQHYLDRPITQQEPI